MDYSIHLQMFALFEIPESNRVPDDLEALLANIDSKKLENICIQRDRTWLEWWRHDPTSGRDYIWVSVQRRGSLASVSGSGPGLGINVIYNSSVNSAPAGFTTAIQEAVQYLESVIITPITVNINVG